MNKPSAALVAQYVLRDGLKEFVLLPIWWYSTGLLLMLQWFAGSIKGSVRFFALDVWVKNLFVPMYGEESISGRLISFGVRLFMIIVRSIGVAGLCVLVVALALLYLLGFPILIIGIFGNLVGMI